MGEPPQLGAYHDYRGYAGQVASGVFAVGDEITVLPRGHTTTIAGIQMSGRSWPRRTPNVGDHAPGRPLDIGRGDMFCRPHNQPLVTRQVEAMVCALWDTPLRPGGRYLLKHTTRTVRAVLDELRYSINVNTLHRNLEATQLDMNEVGRVHLRTGEPLFVDEYRANHDTGSFILIDETTYDTVGAGMVAGSAQSGWPSPDDLPDAPGTDAGEAG